MLNLVEVPDRKVLASTKTLPQCKQLPLHQIMRRPPPNMMHHVVYVRRVRDYSEVLSDQIRDLEGELSPRSLGSVLLEECPGLGGRHRAHGEKLGIHSTLVEDVEGKIGFENSKVEYT